MAQRACVTMRRLSLVLTSLVLHGSVVFGQEEYGECAFGLGNESVVSTTALETALLDGDYDKNCRPSMAEFGTLNAPPETVLLNFWVTSYALNELTQTLGLRGYLHTLWEDKRLAHGAASPECAHPEEEVWILSEARWHDIWRPDTYGENTLSIEDRSDAASGTWIYPNGSVFDSRFVNADLECKLHVDLLPFDKQECTVMLASYTQTVNDVLFVPRGGGGNDAAVVGESAIDPNAWELVRTSAKQIDKTYEIADGLSYTYSTVELSLHVERKSNYHVLYSMVPALLFVCVSYNGFFLPRGQASARVANAVIPVLVIRVLQNGVFSRLELISYRIYLAEFLMIAMFLSCFCVFEYGLVAHYYQREEEYVKQRQGLMKMTKRLNEAIAKRKRAKTQQGYKNVVSTTAVEEHQVVLGVDDDAVIARNVATPVAVQDVDVNVEPPAQEVKDEEEEDEEEGGYHRPSRQPYRHSQTSGGLTSQTNDVSPGNAKRRRRSRQFPLAVALRRWLSAGGGRPSEAQSADGGKNVRDGDYDPTYARDLAEMEDIIERFDADGNGQIDAFEAAELLRCYGIFVDVNCATAMMLHYLYVTGSEIPHDAVHLTPKQLVEFITAYDEKYNIGETRHTFMSKPHSLRIDIACRYLFIPVCFFVFFFHWIWWFPADQGK